MYTLIINRDAQAEFLKEIQYSQKTWGAAHAKKYKFELESKIYNLKANPYICPIKHDISERIRVLKHKGNNIVYTVVEERKEILIIAIQSTYKEITANLIERT